jgi:hypothetical protein
MTIDDMVRWFDLIQDKSESVYFNNENKIDFINNAQDLFVNRVLFAFLQGQKRATETPIVSSGIENTSSTLEKIRPLVLEDIAISSIANGVITFNSLEGQILSLTGSSEEILHVLNVSDSGNFIRFVRHNDYYKHNKNSFKKAEIDYPTFRLNSSGIKINPEGIKEYNVSLIKTPKKLVYISLGDPANINSELPESTHFEIMSIALEFAGLSSRDEALIQTPTIRNES